MTEDLKLKHLLSRATFGQNTTADFATKTTKHLLKYLLNKKEPHTFIQVITLAEMKALNDADKMASKETKKDIKKQIQQYEFEINWQWWQQMVENPKQLHEKMALFWHGHFACRSNNPYYDQQYLDVIRANAMGNFATLLYEVSKTPSMLQFLNNQQNKKAHPNENFAREVMELFTLGRGNYTEQDVKEAARAFTGYGFNKEAEFVFRDKQHDTSTKTFLGNTGNFNGDDILDIILQNKQCACFIATKVYRYFVNDKIEKENVQQLADVFYKSKYNIKAMMHTLFTATWFYDEKNIAAKIKSPIELLTGMSRVIPITFEDKQSSIFIQRALGQVLLNPPSVAGWSGGLSWIDSSSLLFRMRLPKVIYNDNEIDFSIKETLPEMNESKLGYSVPAPSKITIKKITAQADWKTMCNRFVNSNKKEKDIADFLLLKQPDALSLQLISKVTDNTTAENAIKSIAVEIMSLPEYQLC